MLLKKKYIWFAIVVCVVIALSIVDAECNIFAYNNHKDSGISGDVFTLMTFNINASDSASFPIGKKNALMELIEREKPDIVCFQELSFDNLNIIKPQLDSIYGPCEILKGDNQMWRLKFYSHFPLRNFSRHRCDGEFDTSDLTDEEKHMIEQSQKQMSVMSAEFEVELGKWVRLYSGHFRSNAYSTARDLWKMMQAGLVA